ncbi:MAG TPA: DUF1802 family protein [Tepidisphaeraceae bacterium]|jgi:hypothetical protein|nr:DUF1802 family protein [Tepidisphaeraceae bacterium]
MPRSEIMSLPPNLQVGLKEWASVCAAIEEGRQIILLRKGGINDAGGVFELEERAFLLFPTYLHQKRHLLKPGEHAAFQERGSEPDMVRLSAAAVVTDVLRLRSREQVDALDAEHVWTADQIDLRFNYKPVNPLFLVLLRAYWLPAITTIPNTPVYAGCRSWVPFDQSASTAGATPVLDDAAFEARRQIVLTATR